MARGDFCRVNSDCNNNQFFETGLVCISGVCQEPFVGPGATLTPTPTKFDICPPRGTFINCTTQNNGAVVGIFHDGLQLEDGTCGTYESVTDLCKPPQPPITCIKPSGPFEKTITRSCQSIDSTKYIGGTAKVTQKRSYEESNNSGECSYTEWEDVSIDTSTCISTYKTTIYTNPPEAGVVTGVTDKTPIPRNLPNGRKQLEATIGTPTVFNATENQGYTFIGWYLNNTLWSTNKSSKTDESDNVFEARFKAIEQPIKCKCYFVAPIVSGTPFTVRYTDCATNTLVTNVFNSATNICAANIPAPISNAQVARDINKDCTETKTCTEPTSCIPPTGGFTRTINVSCTTISDNFISGNARQTQTRGYSSDDPPGTTCKYTDWVNSGSPDTSLCKTRTTTCKAPSGPFTRQISIPCSQVDVKYTSGTATQNQVRGYDKSATGVDICPYTTWQNSGNPNTATCKQPVYWRNCITGELVEGDVPDNYRQLSFSSGGVCWEPIVELTFTPNLNETLKYRYQRGSPLLPESKTTVISNTSTGISYSVKITTNPNIVLSVDGESNGKGTITFIVPPRSEKKLTVIVGQEMLQQLQDGVSTLLMQVDYEQIIL